MEILNYTLYIMLLTFWFSTIPVAFLTLSRFVRNRKTLIEKDLRRIYNDPIIIFQITTRSATKTKVVERGINSIIRASNEINYSNYKISVVTEDENDRKNVVKLKNSEIIVVKRGYKTNAIKKARALQYAVEYRKNTSENTKNFWIFHMDDESYVTNQTLLSLLKYIREGKGVASEGPIVYPLKFESANPITALAESVRPFGCYDCVSQMTNPPPLHLHGSNLLVRSDIEDTIGWNFGETLAEDQVFGYKIYERYGANALGWHGGILLEQPPLNIKDHFMQRRRWILGTLQNMDKFPFWHKFKIGFKLASYFMGFVSGIVSTILYIITVVPLFIASIQILIDKLEYNPLTWIQYIISSFFPTVFPEITNQINSITSNNIYNPVDLGSLSLLLLFPYIMWLLSYQIGLTLNLRYNNFTLLKKITFHSYALILSLILGLIETFPAFIAILEYQLRKRIKSMEGIPNYDFYVVNK
ncbi:MAG TPA: glycosyltransferase family 2 protein [Nitrososphaeraceae archaeon]|nr:glycosyltransferase family 2 protein [Nitrososphaeraceae archaeon]